MRWRLAGTLTTILLVSHLAGYTTAQPPIWADAEAISGWWGDSVNDVHIDTESGDIYVVGAYRFDLHAGELSLEANQHETGNTTDIFVGKWSDGDWAWLSTAGGPDDDWGAAITIATDGSVYVAGGFKSNTSVFGNFELNNTDQTPRTLTTSPTSEAFVGKLDPTTGNWTWAYSFQGQSSDWAVALEPAPSGGVFVVGNYASDPIYDGGSSLMPGWADGGLTDSFLVEFDSTGAIASHASLFDADSSLEVHSMALTSNGKVMVAGYFLGQAAYGVPNKTVNDSPGYSEGMIASWDPSSNTWEWIASIGGQNSEEIYSIDADETGGAYVLSRTSSRVTYSIDPDNSSRISNTNTGLTGTTDVMVSKISNEGKWQWTESVSGAGNDDAHAIASMSGGAIVLGGTASLQLAFDTHSILKSDDPLNMDLWMAGISDNGIWEWALGLGMAKWPEATSLHHSNGKTAMGGSFSTTHAEFGNLTIQNWDNESTYQWPDGFLATLDHSHRSGCTDENAPNFDASATVDDGTCQADGGNSSTDGTSDGSGQGDDEDSGGGSILGMISALLIVGLIGIIIFASRNSEESSDE